jgi:hypothetical protein
MAFSLRPSFTRQASEPNAAGKGPLRAFVARASSTTRAASTRSPNHCVGGSEVRHPPRRSQWPPSVPSYNASTLRTSSTFTGSDFPLFLAFFSAALSAAAVALAAAALPAAALAAALAAAFS